MSTVNDIQESLVVDINLPLKNIKLEVNLEDTKNLISGELSKPSHGDINFGVSEGRRIILNEEKQIVCNFSLDSHGKFIDTFNIFNDMGKLQYSGKFANNDFSEITIYNLNGTYKWKIDGFGSYHYCFESLNEGIVFFNVEQNLAKGYCLWSFSGKEKKVYYDKGIQSKRFLWCFRVCLKNNSNLFMSTIKDHILFCFNFRNIICSLEQNASSSIHYNPIQSILNSQSIRNLSHTLETNQNTRDRDHRDSHFFTLLDSDNLQHELRSRCLHNRIRLTLLLRMINLHISTSNEQPA